MVRQSAHPLEVAIALQKLAEILLELGKLDESKSMFCESLDYYEQVPEVTEKFDFDIFECRGFRVGIDRGQVYRECIEIHRQFFREGYDHIGFSRILLGCGLTSGSDIDELCYCECLYMQRRIFGANFDHADISRTLFLLAGVMRRKRAFAHSIDLYQESLEMDRRLYDECAGHGNVTITMSNLAWTLCEDGQLEEAERLLREYFAMEKRLVRESTKELLEFLCALADRAQKNAVFDVAERLYREITELLDDLLISPSRFDVAVANHKLAFSLLCLGDSKAAEERLLQGLNEFEHLSSVRDWRSTFFNDVKIHKELIDICAKVFDGSLDHLGLANLLQQAGVSAWYEEDFVNVELKFTSSLAMKGRLWDEEKESMSHGLFWLGRVMRGKIELDEGELFLRKSLDIMRRTVGVETDCKDVLMSMHELSCVLGEKGELVEAELQMRKALEMGQRLNGGRTIRSDTAIGFYKLVTSALKNGAFSDCERFCQISLDVGRHCMKPLHLATTLLVRAISFIQRDKYLEGEEAFREAIFYFQLLRYDNGKEEMKHYAFIDDDLKLIEEEESYFGDAYFEDDFFFPNCVEVYGKLRGCGVESLCLSRILHNVACRARDSEDLEKAEELFRHALSMKRRLLGRTADHSSISLTLFALADVMRRRHLYEESEALYRENLRMDRRLQCTRNGDLNVAITCNELAWVMLKRGEVADAGSFHRESLEVKKRLHLRDFMYWRSLLNVGYDMWNDYALDDAERLFRECLSETRRLHGGDVDRTDNAEVLVGVGQILSEKDKLDDADAFFRESLDMCLRICGDTVNHVRIWFGFERGRTAFAKYEVEEAKRLFNEALEMAQWLIANDCCGGNDWDVCLTLHWLARVAIEENDLAFAEKLCQDSLAAAWKEVETDADHEEIANVLLVKARVAYKKGTMEESEQLCRESMEMRQRMHGIDCRRPEIAEALHILGKI